MEVQENPNAEGEEKPEKKYDVDDRMDQDKDAKDEDRTRDDKKDEVSQIKHWSMFKNMYTCTELLTKSIRVSASWIERLLSYG